MNVAPLISLGISIMTQLRKAYVQSRKGVKWVKKITRIKK